jgi:hypothetical protein
LPLPENLRRERQHHVRAAVVLLHWFSPFRSARSWTRQLRMRPPDGDGVEHLVVRAQTDLSGRARVQRIKEQVANGNVSQVPMVGDRRHRHFRPRNRLAGSKGRRHQDGPEEPKVVDQEKKSVPRRIRP